MRHTHDWEVEILTSLCDRVVDTFGFKSRHVLVFQIIAIYSLIFLRVHLPKLFISTNSKLREGNEKGNK